MTHSVQRGTALILEQLRGSALANYARSRVLNASFFPYEASWPTRSARRVLRPLCPFTLVRAARLESFSSMQEGGFLPRRFVYPLAANCAAIRTAKLRLIRVNEHVDRARISSRILPRRFMRFPSTFSPRPTVKSLGNNLRISCKSC